MAPERIYKRLSDLLTFWDMLLIAVLLALPLIAIINSAAARSAPGSVVVNIEGHTVYRAAAGNAVKRFTGYGGMGCTLEIKEKGIRMIAADCPDHLCCRKGWTGPGGSIVCLPARISVSFISQTEEMDGITR